jgi:hypothetical protein
VLRPRARRAYRSAPDLAAIVDHRVAIGLADRACSSPGEALAAPLRARLEDRLIKKIVWFQLAKLWLTSFGNGDDHRRSRAQVTPVACASAPCTYFVPGGSDSIAFLLSVQANLL